MDAGPVNDCHPGRKRRYVEKAIPGFDKLSGLMTMIAVAADDDVVLDRTLFMPGFYANMDGCWSLWWRIVSSTWYDAHEDNHQTHNAVFC